jgi:hypothetical protein
MQIGGVIVPDISVQTAITTTLSPSQIDQSFITQTNTATIPPIPVAGSPDVII